jgi:hypothetical protein
MDICDIYTNIHKTDNSLKLKSYEDTHALTMEGMNDIQEGKQFLLYAQLGLESLNNELSLLKSVKNNFSIENLDIYNFGLEEEEASKSGIADKKKNIFQKIWGAIVSAVKKVVDGIINFFKGLFGKKTKSDMINMSAEIQNKPGELEKKAKDLPKDKKNMIQVKELKLGFNDVKGFVASLVSMVGDYKTTQQKLNVIAQKMQDVLNDKKILGFIQAGINPEKSIIEAYGPLIKKFSSGIKFEVSGKVDVDMDKLNKNISNFIQNEQPTNLTIVQFIDKYKYFFAEAKSVANIITSIEDTGKNIINNTKVQQDLIQKAADTAKEKIEKGDFSNGKHANNMKDFTKFVTQMNKMNNVVIHIYTSISKTLLQFSDVAVKTYKKVMGVETETN